MNYKELYEKLVNGDHLTDKELEALYDHLATAGKMLRQLGQVYQLSAAELERRAEQVSSYLHARKRA